MPDWLYVLTDLQGTVKGEITNPQERACALPLNRLDTASCRVPLHHPMGVAMADSGEKMLKVYRNHGAGYGDPLMVGTVMTSEESADFLTQTVGINAVGPLWRLSKRLLGTTKAGQAFGSEAQPMEIVTIGKSILQSCNGSIPGQVTGEWTGISDGGVWTPTSPANNTWIGPLYLANAAETLGNLTATVNGFDFKMRYIEPTPSGQTFPTIAYMDAAPILGVQRPGAIFEYGGDAPNLTGYNRRVTRDNIMTRGYTTAPSNESDPRVKQNDTERALRGLYEDTIPDGGVENNDVRDQLIDEHLLYRAKPQEIINVTVAMNARPTFGADYVVGDFVRCRAVVRGIVRFDAMYRIWGVTFSVDTNGNEKIELELVAP